MALEKFNLTGRTVRITGGAGLLGKQHAAALLECGATVVLTDLNKIRKLDSAREELLAEFPKGVRDVRSDGRYQIKEALLD